jgi:hypothetical protein
VLQDDSSRAWQARRRNSRCLHTHESDAEGIEARPRGIPNATRGADVIKRLLSNLGTIGNGLAELRGLYGTGHGKHGSAAGLSARHARLAVGAAAKLTTFLFATHKETKNDRLSLRRGVG